MKMDSFETEEQILKRIILPFPIDKLIENFRPKKLLLQWHITNSCNLYCKHCYQDGSILSSDLPGKDLFIILDQYIQVLRKWDITGHINITGGEPLMNKDLPDLLEKISTQKNLLSFALLSNGSLLSNGFAKKLKKWGCSFYQISIEGNEEIHDMIRGKGNFEKSIEALKILRSNRLKTMVSFTSSKLNVDCFEDVAKLCRKNKVDILWSDRYIPIGKGLDMKKEMQQAFEVEAFFEKMNKLHIEFKKAWFTNTQIKLHRALNFLVSEKSACNCYQPYKCSAGRSLLTIMPNGDVLPCRRMPILIGNVFNTNIEELYEHSILLRMLRKNNVPYHDCKSCVRWDECNGGLRCLAYAYHGNPFSTDPQCFKIYSTLPEN